IVVRDAGNAEIRRFRSEVHLGLNRIVWRLERDGTPGPARELQQEPELPPPGREVLPGEYTLDVQFQDQTQSVKVTVQPDPRVEIPMLDRQAKDALRAQREQLQADLRRATQRLARGKRDIEVVEKRLAIEPKARDGETDPHKALRDAVVAVNKAFTEVEEKLWGKKAQGIVRNDDTLFAQVNAEMRITSTDDAPNATELQGMARAARKAPEITAAVDAFATGPLATFRTAVEQSGLSLLPQIEPVPARK
ncbi:MAG TPA: hypothetical protein VF384_01640, partial [Planctomycetota bacterium]